MNITIRPTNLHDRCMVVRKYGCMFALQCKYYNCGRMNITIGLTNLLDKLTYGPTDQQGLNLNKNNIIKINKQNS